MNTGVTCDVFPEVLKWARETSGVSLDEAARHVGVTTERYEVWEDTKAELPIGQIRALAELYGRPLAALLLPEPLNESVPKPGDVVAVKTRWWMSGWDSSKELAPWCSAEEQAALRDVVDAARFALRAVTNAQLDDRLGALGAALDALEGLPETSE